MRVCRDVSESVSVYDSVWMCECVGMCEWGSNILGKFAHRLSPSLEAPWAQGSCCFHSPLCPQHQGCSPRTWQMIKYLKEWMNEWVSGSCKKKKTGVISLICDMDLGQCINDTEGMIHNEDVHITHTDVVNYWSWNIQSKKKKERKNKLSLRKIRVRHLNTRFSTSDRSNRKNRRVRGFV